MSAEQSLQQTHWQRTKKLMVVTLSIWFVFSFVVHWFADSLNAMSFLGFPFGFYMAAQGSEVIFVVLIFVFAHLQNKIDVECGMAEDE